MTGPDFIIIGAMKCGTSTLATQLGDQAGLFMTTPKEPNYFSDETVYSRGPGWYAALFEAAREGDIRGEASTHYTKRPTYPKTLDRMAAALPEIRLVYMIRNPLDRLISHYIHEWSEARISGALDEAVEEVGDLVDYGRYGWQIAPFIETYGKEAVLLTSLERLAAEPQAELDRIARHIGHTGPVRWNDGIEAQNVSSERVRKLPMHELLVDHPVATALRRNLVPKALRTRIRDARRMAERPRLSAARERALENRFAEDRALLAGFFPDDPSLDLAYPFLT